MALIPRLRQVGWLPPHISARMLIRWWMILRVTLVSTTMAVAACIASKGCKPRDDALFLEQRHAGTGASRQTGCAQLRGGRGERKGRFRAECDQGPHRARGP